MEWPLSFWVKRDGEYNKFHTRNLWKLLYCVGFIVSVCFTGEANHLTLLLHQQLLFQGLVGLTAPVPPQRDSARVPPLLSSLHKMAGLLVFSNFTWKNRFYLLKSCYKLVKYCLCSYTTAIIELGLRYRLSLDRKPRSVVRSHGALT